MTCIVFASSKGGAGKTTSCVALAEMFVRAGYATAVLELDRNSPIADYAAVQEKRGRSTVTVLPSPPDGERLPITLKRLQKDHEVLFVDLPGAATTEMLTATAAADLVVVPMQAARWDAREAKATHDEIVQLTEDSRRPPIVRILLTRTPAGAVVPGYYTRAVKALETQDLPRFAVELVERKAWRDLQEGGIYPETGAAYDNAYRLFEVVVAELAQGEDAR